MKNILVLTDFSPKAKQAQKLGVALAKQFHAEIHFLHVFDAPVDWQKLPKEQEGRFPEVKARLGNARVELTEAEKLATDAGLRSTGFVSFNYGETNILSHVQSHGHDLIVMGAHSRLKATDVLFGSVAVEVIQNATIPVLMVNEISDFGELSNILLAVNPTDPIGMLAKTRELFPDVSVSLNAFTVNAGRGENLSQIDQKITESGVENVSHELIEAETVEQGIIDKANRGEGDLLAIGSNNFSSLADYLRNHIFPSIGSRVNLPLLILK